MRSGRLTRAGFIERRLVIARAGCLALAFAAALLPLAGCDHTQEAAGSAATEAIDQRARGELAGAQTPIPIAVIARQKGPVAVKQLADMDEDLARKRWQTDRNRLRMCVANHGALVDELTVRGILDEMTRRETGDNAQS
ncbi:MAG: hypothetical protein KDJ69_10055 [Nitratireductor sp.]|nr:hypothetical protein [Nitratireductor sp.]